jgi:hypothetical protein
VRSLELPDQPDEAGRAMQADAGGTDRPTPRSRELPDPDERGRAYEAARAHVSAETPAEPSPGQGPGAGGQRTHKDEAPRLHDTSADHHRRWPENPHAATERSGDRPELPAATAESADRVREAERALLPDAQAIEREDRRGGWPEGFGNRLKGQDRPEENVSAETSDEASRGQPPDAADQRSYWDEVPRFHDMWAKHERHWLERPSVVVDRSGDRQELPAAIVEAIGRIREAEPRLSADAQAVEQENMHGGWLEGFEFRLKGEDRLKEKLAERIEGESDKSPDAIMRKIYDVIRYTFCFQPESYAKGYYDVKERFESRGYEMYFSEDSWTNPEYKGINTRWVTPEGHRFEVQFHTPESFHAKHHVTHLAYARIRTHTRSRAELRELHAFQKAVSSWIQIPDGAADIPDFKKDGY